jgi:hypothetical protein
MDHLYFWTPYCEKKITSTHDLYIRKIEKIEIFFCLKWCSFGWVGFPTPGQGVSHAFEEKRWTQWEAKRWGTSGELDKTSSVV